MQDNNNYNIVSKKCDYALRGVFELALRSNGKPVKVHKLAEAQDIPVRFLEVIFNELKHAEILESRRGNDGGYLLKVPPETLTVNRIINIVQGPKSTESSQIKLREKTGDHAFGKLWRDVNKSLSDIYNNTTIAGLIEEEMFFSNIVSYVI